MSTQDWDYITEEESTDEVQAYLAMHFFYYAHSPQRRRSLSKGSSKENKKPKKVQ